MKITLTAQFDTQEEKNLTETFSKGMEQIGAKPVNFKIPSNRTVVDNGLVKITDNFDGDMTSTFEIDMPDEVYTTGVRTLLALGAVLADENVHGPLKEAIMPLFKMVDQKKKSQSKIKMLTDLVEGRSWYFGDLARVFCDAEVEPGLDLMTRFDGQTFKTKGEVELIDSRHRAELEETLMKDLKDHTLACYDLEHYVVNRVVQQREVLVNDVVSWVGDYVGLMSLYLGTDHAALKCGELYSPNVVRSTMDGFVIYSPTGETLDNNTVTQADKFVNDLLNGKMKTIFK